MCLPGVYPHPRVPFPQRRFDFSKSWAVFPSDYKLPQLSLKSAFWS